MCMKSLRELLSFELLLNTRKVQLMNTKYTNTLHSLALTLICMLSSLGLSAFSIHCPPNYNVNCEAEIWDLSVYGRAYYEDYSGNHYLNYPVVKYYLNSCGTGHITRTWKVYDYDGTLHQCTQTIYVNGGNYNGQYIDWPDQGLELSNCYADTHPSSLPSQYGYPKLPNNYACTLLGYTWEDFHYNFGPYCKKIIRKWRVIDWCQYNPNSSGNAGVWSYDQIIKLTNYVAPTVVVPPIVWHEAKNCYGSLVHVEMLKITDTSCGGGHNVTNNSPYADGPWEDASGTYPIGSTSFQYTVEYGCGYYKKYDYTVHVKDIGPSPICLESLSVALMGVDNDGDGVFDDGMAEIWAKDFDKSSYDACRHQALKYSFSSDVNDAYRVMSCADVGVNNLEMWVTDTKGNQNFCKVKLIVGNNAAQIPNCEVVDPDDDSGTGGEDTGGDGTDGDGTDGEDTGGDGTDGSGTDGGDTDGDSEDGIFGEISGIAKMHYGEAVEGAYVSLASSQIEDEIIQIGEEEVITMIKVDSFKTFFGVWLYIEKPDTTYLPVYDTIPAALNRDMLTLDDGLYAFDNLAKGFDYVLRGHYSVDQTDMITSEDATAVFAHVLGTAIIEDPLALLAADVDDSGVVDLADVTLLTDYVTGKISELPNAQDWYVFLSYGDTLTTDSLALPDLRKDQTTVDIVIVRKGDVVKSPSEVGLRNKNNTNIDLQDLSNRLRYEVEVWPNPFGNELQLNVNAIESGQAKIDIYTIDGRLVSSNLREVNEGDNFWKIDTDLLADKTMYIYRLSVNGQLMGGKVYKIR